MAERIIDIIFNNKTDPKVTGAPVVGVRKCGRQIEELVEDAKGGVHVLPIRVMKADLPRMASDAGGIREVITD